MSRKLTQLATLEEGGGLAIFRSTVRIECAKLAFSLGYAALSTYLLLVFGPNETCDQKSPNRYSFSAIRMLDPKILYQTHMAV